MSFEPRVIVTGHDSDGKSVFVSDEPREPTTITARPGSDYYQLWGTADGLPVVGDAPVPPTVAPFFPGPGGTRVLYLRMPPESAAATPSGEPDTLVTETNEKLPGLMDAFEPGAPGVHTTQTIDYGICIEGEVHLELDDGEEVRLTPGTCVVQRGTRHAWHNRSHAPALMCFVIIGAGRGA